MSSLIFWYFVINITYTLIIGGTGNTINDIIYEIEKDKPIKGNARTVYIAYFSLYLVGFFLMIPIFVIALIKAILRKL